MAAASSSEEKKAVYVSLRDYGVTRVNTDIEFSEPLPSVHGSYLQPDGVTPVNLLVMSNSSQYATIMSHDLLPLGGKVNVSDGAIKPLADSFLARHDTSKSINHRDIFLPNVEGYGRALLNAASYAKVVLEDEVCPIPSLVGVFGVHNYPVSILMPREAVADRSMPSIEDVGCDEIAMDYISWVVYNFWAHLNAAVIQQEEPIVPTKPMWLVLHHDNDYVGQYDDDQHQKEKHLPAAQAAIGLTYGQCRKMVLCRLGLNRLRNIKDTNSTTQSSIHARGWCTMDFVNAVDIYTRAHKEALERQSSLGERKGATVRVINNGEAAKRVNAKKIKPVTFERTARHTQATVDWYVHNIKTNSKNICKEPNFVQHLYFSATDATIRWDKGPAPASAEAREALRRARCLDFYWLVMRVSIKDHRKLLDVKLRASVYYTRKAKGHEKVYFCPQHEPQKLRVFGAKARYACIGVDKEMFLVHPYFAWPDYRWEGKQSIVDESTLFKAEVKEKKREETKVALKVKKQMAAEVKKATKRGLSVKKEPAAAADADADLLPEVPETKKRQQAAAKKPKSDATSGKEEKKEKKSKPKEIQPRAVDLSQSMPTPGTSDIHHPRYVNPNLLSEMWATRYKPPQSWHAAVSAAAAFEDDAVAVADKGTLPDAAACQAIVADVCPSAAKSSLPQNNDTYLPDLFYALAARGEPESRIWWIMYHRKCYSHAAARVMPSAVHVAAFLKHAVRWFDARLDTIRRSAHTAVEILQSVVRSDLCSKVLSSCFRAYGICNNVYGDGPAEPRVRDANSDFTKTFFTKNVFERMLHECKMKLHGVGAAEADVMLADAVDALRKACVTGKDLLSCCSARLAENVTHPTKSMWVADPDGSSRRLHGLHALTGLHRLWVTRVRNAVFDYINHLSNPQTAPLLSTGQAWIHVVKVREEYDKNFKGILTKLRKIFTASLRRPVDCKLRFTKFTAADITDRNVALSFIGHYLEACTQVESGIQSWAGTVKEQEPVFRQCLQRIYQLTVPSGTGPVMQFCLPNGQLLSFSPPAAAGASSPQQAMGQVQAAAAAAAQQAAQQAAAEHQARQHQAMMAQRAQAEAHAAEARRQAEFREMQVRVLKQQERVIATRFEIGLPIDVKFVVEACAILMADMNLNYNRDHAVNFVAQQFAKQGRDHHSITAFIAIFLDKDGQYPYTEVEKTHQRVYRLQATENTPGQEPSALALSVLQRYLTIIGDFYEMVPAKCLQQGGYSVELDGMDAHGAGAGDHDGGVHMLGSSL